MLIVILALVLATLLYLRSMRFRRRGLTIKQLYTKKRVFLLFVVAPLCYGLSYLMYSFLFPGHERSFFFVFIVLVLLVDSWIWRKVP